MDRLLKTSQEITAEVTRMLAIGMLAKGSADVVTVGAAKLLPRPDGNGCNWYMDYFTGMRGHVAEAGAALVDVKRRWNLAE